MGNEISTQTKPYSLVAADFKEAMQIATVLANSDMVPKDFKGKVENVFVAVQWGQEIGLPPLQALQNIAVINGRPSIWGDAALAVVMAHPQFSDIAETLVGNGDSMVAKCLIKRKGKSDTVREFSAVDAKRAGLWGKGGPWTQYPQRMLQMRARAFALRDAFPDAIKGISIAEEAQDIEEINPRPQSQEKQKEVEILAESLPLYPQEKFELNLPAWAKAISCGKKTQDDVIAMIQTKYTFTAEQLTKVKELRADLSEVIEGEKVENN